MSLRIRTHTADDEAVRTGLLAQLREGGSEQLRRVIERSMQSTMAVSITYGTGTAPQPSSAERSAGEELVTIEFPEGPVTRDRRTFTPTQEAYYQASQYMNQEDWQNAIAAFRKVIDLKPNPIFLQGVLVMMGMAYYQAGEPNQALHAFEEAISIDEQSDVAHLFLGTTLMLAGDFRNAIGPLKRSLELNPHDYNTNFYLGYVYGELGQWAEAIASYNAELAEHVDFTPAYEQLGKLYFKLAEKEPTQGSQYYLKIIETYKRWLQVDPENSSVRNLIGYLYEKIGNTPEAIRGYEEAVKADPNNAIALSAWGAACLNAEHNREAKEIFERLVKLGEDVVRAQLSRNSPDDLDEAVRLTMAEAYQLLGAANLMLYQSQAQAGGQDAAERSLLSEAEAAFKTALRYDPVHVHSLYNLGVIYYMTRRRAAAAELLRRVLELDPRFPDAADVLHTVQSELEQWRRWMGTTVGRFAESSSPEQPVYVEDLVEKLAECRAKLYEGVDPGREDEAFTPEDLLNAMLPVAEWLSKGGNDEARFIFAALVFERGWLSSGKAALLAGLDRVTFLTNLHRVGIAVLDLDEEELENQASYVNAE